MSVSQGPAAGGTAVTLSGTNLAGVTEVDLGPATPAPSVSRRA